MISTGELLAEVDRLIETGRAEEAKEMLIKALEQAKEEDNTAVELQILNELIGYYRVTSDRENLLITISGALEAAQRMELQEFEGGRIPFATTLLNAANAYRSIGELEKSKEYYEIVEAIYAQELPADDMRVAGFYNNASLLYQEMGDYQKAVDSQKKALEIVSANDASFEIAVTYANLANTEFQRADYAATKEYALEAIRRFEEDGTIDAHYCAALSALGLCFYQEGQYRKASEIFERGMGIIEKNLGRNSQYDRLKKNRDLCENRYMTGLKLSRKYYEECGAPALEKNFPEYISQMAIGLAGEGSDCFGYDDEASMDHDWGPDFCIWLPDDLYEKIGEEVAKVYEQLPAEYMGYKRTVSKRGGGRRGVMSLSMFYGKFLGTSDYARINWQKIPDYSLAAAANGEMFRDDNGAFSYVREKLKEGYPEPILYLHLAQDLAKIAQTGQYNYARMLKRGDRFTADQMLADCMKHLMILAHHMENVYPPHEKWLKRSFEKVAAGSVLEVIVKKLHSSYRLTDEEALNVVPELVEQAAVYIADQLYARDIISDVEPFLDYHTDELARKASYARMTDEQLVQTIAETEFAAFDKVRNEGGRASCQNDWPTFSVMRKSQYMTWNRTMLIQYLYDFVREFELGHNLITEKYGRMMESTAKEKYQEIEQYFPPLSEEKKAVIEQIVSIQTGMMDAFGKQYPNLAGNARNFHSYEDDSYDTSAETYLRGEISTYSDKMLQLYGRYVVAFVAEGKNIALETIKNTAKLYGYADLEAFEKDAAPFEF